MASVLSQPLIFPHLNSNPNCFSLLHPFSPSPKLRRFKLCAHQNQSSTNSSSTTSISTQDHQQQQDSDSQNALLKVAWYASEFLGLAASFFRPGDGAGDDFSGEFSGADETEGVDRAVVVERIKLDFQRSYFVTGNLTLGAYEEDCEFADPAGSFKGLRRFKRNCTNFGSLIQKSNMKLMKWEDFEDMGIGHWRFSCILSFPWRPILSATGYTEYYFDSKTGKVCRHVEHWNVPKMTLLKQILKPSGRIR